MSSSASGTMAEGSRPAKPASRSTGAEGSRQTVRYARTLELDLQLNSTGTVGGQTSLTPYIVPHRVEAAVGSHMDYDTYGSSAVELAIDLANAELDDPVG